MKTHTLVYTLAALLLAPLGLAQAPIITTPGAPAAPAATATASPTIKGTLDISFDATGTGKVVKGATDKYTFDVLVANSAHFHGTINRLPPAKGSFGTSYGAQAGSLTYDIGYDLINYKNPRQSIRDIGDLAGTVPTNYLNVYDFEGGDLTMNTHAHGKAGSLTSRFAGQALGKPPAGSPSLKTQALTFFRVSHGNTLAKKVTKYDTMDFRQHILGAGPSPELEAVQVNGSMVYNYDDGNWYLKDITCVYGTFVNGVQTPHTDTLTGSIRWKEDDNRASNGQGEYDFDIRVNEPPASDNAAFDAKPSDNDDDFFATNDAVPGLTGTMKYVDQIIPGSITKANPDGNVTSSAITIDLKGNGLSREQVVYLSKLLLFSAVVPINSN
jgi:hypothetical protein